MTIDVVSPFYQQVKLQLVGMKRVFKQDLQMFGLKLLQISIIFTHLKLWVAVARQLWVGDFF